MTACRLECILFNHDVSIRRCKCKLDNFFAAYSTRCTSKLVETVWIFEKDKTTLFDDTPIYEGVIIEYLHRVEVSHYDGKLIQGGPKK